MLQNELHEWLVKNSSATGNNHLLHSKLETFRDHNGTLRFKGTWLSAEENEIDEENNLNSYNSLNTGVVSIPAKVLSKSNYYESTPNDIEVRLLSDWKKLWDYLKNDDEDEIAKYAPLLKAFTTFIYHKKITYLFIFLGIYNLCLTLTLGILFNNEKIFNLVLELSYSIVGIATYCAAKLLLEGTSSNRNDQKKNLTTNQRIESHSKNLNKFRTTEVFYHHSPNFRNAFAQCCIAMVYECKRTCCYFDCKSGRCHFNHPMQEFVRTRTRLSFYQLLNISLKFLTRHNRVNMNHINFDRPAYRYALMATGLILPLFEIFTNFAPLFGNNEAIACVGQTNTDACKYITYYAYFTLGIVTVQLFQIIFSTSVLVLLVALAYGAEIAYRITISWIQRFNGLRKVEVKMSDGQEYRTEKEVIPHSTHEEMKNSNNESTALTHQTVAVSNTIINIPIKAKLPTAKDFYSENDSDNDSKDNEMDTQNPINSDQTKGKTNKSIEFDDFQTKIFEFQCHLTDNELIPYITRDSYEHYLFIREYMNQAGIIWSPAIVCLIFLTIYICLIGIFVGVTAGYNSSNFIQIALFVASRVGIFFIYPICSLSHANSFIDLLSDTFVVASPEDYSILGGREKWIGYIQSVPAVWTLHGLWVTWDRLAGLLWALFVSLASGLIACTTAT